MNKNLVVGPILVLDTKTLGKCSSVVTTLTLSLAPLGLSGVGREKLIPAAGNRRGGIQKEGNFRRWKPITKQLLVRTKNT